MKKLLILLFLLLGCAKYGLAQQGFSDASLVWKSIAKFHNNINSPQEPGYAGMYAGVAHDILIMAGGANFPENLPWEGGKKHYSDQVFYMLHDESQKAEIKQFTGSLPQPMAYGASINFEDGIILIGGENESGLLRDVLFLKPDLASNRFLIESLPNLPWQMSYLSAVKIGKTLYVQGSTEEKKAVFLSLDLKKKNGFWNQLPVYPGPARTNAGMVIQTDGESEKIYLLGGRQKRENGVSDVFSDIFSFDPGSMKWKKEGKMQDEKGVEIKRSAHTLLAAGSGHILIIGGLEPEPFNTLERLGKELQNEKLSQEKLDSLVKLRDKLLINHSGFNKEVLAYHTVTGTWTRLEDLPFSPPANSILISNQNDYFLISGEISPGIRSPWIQKLKLRSDQSFGSLNYTILGLYLGILVLIGFWVSKKQHNVSDFFKAGGRVPWWAAGISVFGTQLSAITFMAIPSKTFATDWTLFFLLMTIIMVSPLIIAWFLPFYRRMNLTTAYEYLEMRYNSTVRIMGSSIYIILQLGRLGIVLLLPSLALSTVTGIEVELCILLMGILSIVYTVLGGIEAVIWTDVIQVGVLLGGALICLILMFFTGNISWLDIKTLAIESGKTQFFDWSLDFSGTAIWVVLLGGLASNIVQYGSDQTVIQRYLTTKDEKTAAKGITAGAWMALPSALIFFSIGTALYLFYLKNPQELSPVVQNTDSIFPGYIVTQLPDGVSGLLIAAVFAAAMSSLDSSMNSVATVITTDFYQQIRLKKLLPINELGFARTVTIIIGSIGTALAVWMANMGIPSLWDQFNMLIGLFAGGLGGIFLVGILSSSVNGKGATYGLLGSALIQVLVKYYSPLSIHLYALTGLISAMTLTWILSRFFTDPHQKSKTQYTLSALNNKVRKSSISKTQTENPLTV